ncbi:hypothetical protein ACIQXD_29815 [Streptomyces uncialis]
MTPADFTDKQLTPHQDVLFLAGEDDPCGTPTLDGLDGHIVHPEPER